MNAIDPNVTVGELVAQRPARSRVFEVLGIDFCCGGKRPLREACAAKGLDAATVATMLAALESGGPAQDGADWTAATMTALCDHIEATHHAYLRAELPRLAAMVRKVVDAHAERDGRLRELHAVFHAFTQELASHMMKEEQVLFPIVRAIESGDTDPRHCGSVRNPIGVMEHEHDQAGLALARMRELTSDYTPPADACNTWRALLDGLRELEQDMHQHVHKENNILFPRAAEAEGVMAAVARRD